MPETPSSKIAKLYQDRMAIAGNINLDNRKPVKNPDGSISTVRSMSVGFGDNTYLIPTVVNGRIVSDDEAIQYHIKTGEHLGAFLNQQDADSYSEDLHKAQSVQYQNLYTGPRRERLIPQQKLDKLQNHIPWMQ